MLHNHAFRPGDSVRKQEEHRLTVDTSPLHAIDCHCGICVGRAGTWLEAAIYAAGTVIVGMVMLIAFLSLDSCSPAATDAPLPASRQDSDPSIVAGPVAGDAL